ncbi:MAG: HAMP domain-containing histidine kinase [Lachnospiraceae bacterium]|nr:HAMP domain-containing histidine kinase [Lachnospiraceae bacterium]
MYKNSEFRYMIISVAVFTAVISVCGYALCGIAAFILLMLTGAVLTCVSVYFTRRRYADIEALNSYLVRVLAGEENQSILDQKEGELSLLKTNIYKTTSTLYYQKELLSKDKAALADAIADISHQLKTPLTSMIVMNDLLKTEEDNDKRIEFLNTQSNQLDRMSWLIQTLLKLSKIDAGTIAMKPEEIKADELIKEVIKPFEIQMDLKNITYSQNDSDMTFKCDKNWTIEALQNIVKNCIEHMDNGGSLVINVSDTNIFRQITVKDTGCGICNEDLPHIFERFYKGKNAGKDSVGIGLALSKSIITSQHGDIIVESKEVEGTTFFVRFYKTII